MKSTALNIRTLLVSIMIVATFGLLAGCEQVTPIEDPPDTQTAASLAAVSRAPASVDDNLALLEMFDTPMSMAAEESGLYGGVDGDVWTSEAITIPQISAVSARAFKDVGDLRIAAADAQRGRSKTVDALRFAETVERDDPAPGDTLSVNYYLDNPAVDGLDALIYVDPPNRLRYVSLRNHPAAPALLPVRSLTEVVFDTGGTLEDASDDVHYGLHAEEEWANGQLTTGDLAAETEGDPIASDGVAVALHRTENPMFNPLQAWQETEVRLSVGSLETDEDDVMHALRSTVHYLNDAELTAQIHEIADGPIVDDATVSVSSAFTAAPVNPWLESVTDTIRMRLVDLDDETDDLLESIGRESIFDGVDMHGENPSSTVSFTPAEPVAQDVEPDAGVFSQVVFYDADFWLLRLERTLTINADGSGALEEELEFQDGTVFTRTVTWDGAGNATLVEERPNGDVVNGTWNENDGEFTVTTTFAAGSDPVSRVQSRVFSEGAYAFSDEIEWQDGHADLTVFSVTGDDDSFTAVGHTERGDVVEDFTLVGEPGLLEGDWSRNDGASGSFDLEALSGGGSHLVFDAEEGGEGDCSVAGDIWFAADGSGHGTLTVTDNGVTVILDIEFGPDGTGLLHDGEGNSYPLS